MKNIDHITEESIQKLVDSFYEKVREDESLGPVFSQAIGINADDWRPHLQRMYDFWSAIMLGSRRYHGSPLQKHRELPSFDQGLFDRWLVLFGETAHSIHTKEVAEYYVDKSRRIAESLKFGLYFTP